jgi:hypothetical protein
MISEIEAKKSLFVSEWNMIISNDCDYAVSVDLGHNQLMTKIITISEKFIPSEENHKTI